MHILYSVPLSSSSVIIKSGVDNFEVIHALVHDSPLLAGPDPEVPHVAVPYQYNEALHIKLMRSDFDNAVGTINIETRDHSTAPIFATTLLASR
jgi:hypothetical protein